MSRKSFFAMLAIIGLSSLFQNCGSGFTTSYKDLENKAQILASNEPIRPPLDPSAEPAVPPAPAPPPLPPDPNANPKLLAIPPNTALDLGPFKCDQPTDGGSCYASTDYSRITYDSGTHQVLSWGGGHGIVVHTDVQALNLGTLKWSAHTPSTLCSQMTTAGIDASTASWKATGQPFARHTWDMGVIAEVNGVSKYIILSSGGIGSTSAESCYQGPENKGGAVPYPPGNISPKINFYDIKTAKWTFGKVNPETYWYYASSAEYDPISKKIIVAIGEGGSVYDQNTDTVIARFPAGGALKGYSNNLVYFPPNQKMYYMMRGSPTEVSEIDLNRNDWSKTLPKLVNSNGPATDETGWAYDSKNQVIAGGVADGKIHIYDPVSNTWSTQVMKIQSEFGATAIGSLPSSSHALDFDSMEGVFIFLANGHTWAYRYK